MVRETVSAEMCCGNLQVWWLQVSRLALTMHTPQYLMTLMDWGIRIGSHWGCYQGRQSVLGLFLRFSNHFSNHFYLPPCRLNISILHLAESQFFTVDWVPITRQSITRNATCQSATLQLHTLYHNHFQKDLNVKSMQVWVQVQVQPLMTCSCCLFVCPQTRVLVSLRQSVNKSISQSCVCNWAFTR